MKSDEITVMPGQATETGTPSSSPTEIVDRGRGPEIKGTRITVYDVMDYLSAAWHPDRIASWFRISSAQVRAAIHYIREHKVAVTAEYAKILERHAAGHPPELQVRLDANHQKFLGLVGEIRQAKALGASGEGIRKIIDRFRETHGLGKAHACDHG